MNDPEELIQLVYTSHATVPCDARFIGVLLQRARANNAKLGVSGVLLHHTGAFLQVLEGTPAVVTELFATIERDPRHDRVLILQRRPVSERSFSDWSMGLLKTDARSLREVPTLAEFLEGGVLNLAEDALRLSKILDGFRQGHWRQNIA